MVHKLLESLARDALNRAGGTITEGAKEYWNAIRSDPRTPDPPFDQSFREDAFEAWGLVTKGHNGGSTSRSRNSRR